MTLASAQSRPQPSAGVTIAAELAFDGIRHDYHGQFTVDGVSLHAEPGELLCLLGPSGSGKTTLLRLAAGLELPREGRILLNGQEMSGPGVFVPPERRGVGMMFQDFALFPHMSVFENVRFGLNALSEAESKKEAMAALERVGLAQYAEQYPHALSGGEQQRVALARALAPRPSVLLMDEPFSGLDSRLKDTVRDETLAILRETRATALMVTHDAEEAMRMADRIALLNEGRLVQIGTAEDLYYRPVDLFAAAFFSELNVFHATVSDGRVSTPLGNFGAGDARNGARVAVAIRLPSVEVREDEGDIPARIVFRRFLGVVEQLGLAIPGTEQVVQSRIRAGLLKSGLREVMLCVNDRDIMVFESG
ncbi:ABC transporter ATP-binding protein [Hoeflea prorocentri]|uniref:ABC transporter ATP-binding protein n=1 Tax=Hoeflea prorocentri TaxID=1922333 RepID=A0A9X3UFW0_9HYPH|nr:ABC transporter ATP-binding protein [Hoeflea prorocentri]MCY6380583.1 ABC transporter ATP-binding protein [Hoeflea prorocentri]MDA5398383.1 ABC transporter ATP-binding protein [Hoeflea prorocentri]